MEKTADPTERWLFLILVYVVIIFRIFSGIEESSEEDQTSDFFFPFVEQAMMTAIDCLAEIFWFFDSGYARF